MPNNPGVVLPAFCDTPWFAPSPCAGPVPRSGLVSEDVGYAVRPFARVLRRTSDRLREAGSPDRSRRLDHFQP
jgi:hypothetical protein